MGAACSSDKQTPLTVMQVTVKSDLHVPSEIDRVTIHFAGVTMATSAELDLKVHALPGTISVVDDGSELGPITITAVGSRNGADQVTQSVKARFALHQTTHVEIVLNRACLGKTCADGTTCVQGACRTLDAGDAGTVEGTGGMSGSAGKAGTGAVAGMSAQAGKGGGGRGGRGGLGGAGGTSGIGGGGAGGSAGAPMNPAPVCTILSPGANQAFTTMTNIPLQGFCRDNGALVTGLVWSNNNGDTLGTGGSTSTTLQVGTYTVTLCASDSVDPQIKGCSSVMITVHDPDPPTVTISSVTQGTTLVPPFVSGMPVSLVASTPGQVVSESWLDTFVGEFASGPGVSLDAPVVGRHRVIVTVTDSLARSADTSTTFVVLAPGETQLVQPFASVNTTLASAANAVASDTMSQVLAGTSLPGVYRFNGAMVASTAEQDLDNTTLPGTVRAITIFESGSGSLVYVGTDGGLVVCDYTQSMAIVKANCRPTFSGGNLRDNQINAITRFAASNGTEYLALGTKKGLFLTTTVAGSTSGNGDVLRDENIAATVASGGQLWIASRTSGLNRYDPVTDTLVNLNAGAPSQVLQAIALDSSGVIWVGSDNGLGRYAPATQTWTVWRTGDAPEPKLISNFVQALAVSSATLASQARDVIWIGTDSGVSRFQLNVPSFMSLTMSDGLPSNNVLSIATLPNGNKIFGTQAGVAVYAGP